MSRLTSCAGSGWLLQREDGNWSYFDNGWLNTQTFGNSAVTTESYNGLGELTTLLNRDNMSNTLSEFSNLVYNASGSRTSATATLTGVSSLSGTLSYGYDSKDELASDGSTRSAGSYTHSFSYDSAGNPTTWMGGSKSFNCDNQNTANTFDGNGNPTTYDSASLTFDPENRMTAFGSALTAGYRADGLRAWKNGSSQTYFLYDGTLPVVELNSSGTVIATNTFGAVGLLSRRVSSTSTFYQFDPQGGTAQRLNSSCGVTSSTGFDAWGNAVGTAGSDPFQYGAQEGYYTDTETGLALLSARYYDPAAGRFLSRDPVGPEGGVNLYGYALADPATLSDPSGLSPQPRPGPRPAGPAPPLKTSGFGGIGLNGGAGINWTLMIPGAGFSSDANLATDGCNIGIAYDIGFTPWAFGLYGGGGFQGTVRSGNLTGGGGGSSSIQGGVGVGVKVGGGYTWGPGGRSGTVGVGGGAGAGIMFMNGTQGLWSPYSLVVPLQLEKG